MTANKTANPRKKRVSPAPISQPTPVIEPANSERNGKPTANDIRARAYEKWEAAGRPSGDGVQYWLQAEAELLTMER